MHRPHKFELTLVKTGVLLTGLFGFEVCSTVCQPQSGCQCFPGWSSQALLQVHVLSSVQHFPSQLRVLSCVCRSWWLPLPVEALREGANMLTILLHPAADLAARAQLAYPYPVPTMQVCRVTVLRLC